MKKRTLANGILTFSLLSIISSCAKNNDVSPIANYTVPTTYTFDNVEYTEASGRISMWAGLTSYLGKSTTRRLSQDTVNYLWYNTNNAYTSETSSNLPFSASSLNSIGFNLAGKTVDGSIIKAYIDSMVKVSQSYTATATPGVAGKVGARLVNFSGVEFNQMVAKGLMGALQMSQACGYLDKTQGDNNTTVTPGRGTEMQHDWDLAFGYIGIPIDYDTAKSYAGTESNRPLALGGYFAERGKPIKAGGIAFEGFRKGRAAINANDYAARDEAIGSIKLILEKTMAAAAYVYTSLPQGSSDLATKLHAMSEAYGFVLALKYRPANSPLTASSYQALLDIMKTSFYELASDASNTKLKQAQTILTNAYGQLQ